MKLLRALAGLMRRADVWAATREADHAAAISYLNGYRHDRR